MKILRFLFSIYSVVVLVLLMFLVLPFVVVASFFDKIRGGNLIYRLCVFWANAWMTLSFIFIKRIYDAHFDDEKKYIILANHISYLDIPMLLRVSRKPLRPLGKIETSKVPIFGFIYKKAIVAVDRSDVQHRVRSMKALRMVLNNGISIFVFPEGTFNETGKPLKSFYNGAFRLAIETQTPILPVLFLDTNQRMPHTSIFSLNPGRSKLVYLEEVPVVGLKEKNVNELKQQVFSQMEEALVRYRAGWIRIKKEETCKECKTS